MTGRKWMIVITDEQYTWIKSVAEKTDLKGSDIIRELIGRCMEDDPKGFVNSLASTQYKIELEELAKKEEELAERRMELQNKLKKEKVAI